MSVLPDHMIAGFAEQGMIAPFRPVQERFGGVTRGLGPCSYDVALSDEFVWFPPRLDPTRCALLRQPIDPADPATFPSEPGGLTRGKVAAYVLRPGEFVLACTEEVITLPNDVLARVADKSTWARLGLQVKNTLIDPGFSGQITLELSNEGAYPLKLVPGAGIAQILFEYLSAPCERPYKGRYMNQRGVVLPRGTGEK